MYILISGVEFKYKSIKIIRSLYLIYTCKNDGLDVAVHHIGKNLMLNEVKLKAVLKHKYTLPPFT
jgi:hypothetical protein